MLTPLQAKRLAHKRKFGYEDARALLIDYIERFHPPDDVHYTRALYWAIQAMNDCLKLGINGIYE